MGCKGGFHAGLLPLPPWLQVSLFCCPVEAGEGAPSAASSIACLLGGRGTKTSTPEGEARTQAGGPSCGSGSHLYNGPLLPDLISRGLFTRQTQMRF